MPIAIPTVDEPERSGARSTFIVDVSIDIDVEELLNGGAEAFCNRAMALMEEKLKVIRAIPWADLKKVLRPLPQVQMPNTSSPETTESASQSPAPSNQSADTPPASE